MTQQISQEVRERVAKWIYEATRVEAEWSERSIVPEAWEDRDDKFRKQFVDIIGKYLAADKLPTPEEAHDSWMDAYFIMGWKYGEKRDTTAKTHPDLLPFDQLPKDERDKDAIFLAFVWLAKQLEALVTTQQHSLLEKLSQEVRQYEESYFNGRGKGRRLVEAIPISALTSLRKEMK